VAKVPCQSAPPRHARILKKLQALLPHFDELGRNFDPHRNYSTCPWVPSTSVTEFALVCFSIEQKSFHDLGESLAANALAFQDFVKGCGLLSGVHFEHCSNSDDDWITLSFSADPDPAISQISFHRE
jgi:hypothetical protein